MRVPVISEEFPTLLISHSEEIRDGADGRAFTARRAELNMLDHRQREVPGPAKRLRLPASQHQHGWLVSFPGTRRPYDRT